MSGPPGDVLEMQSNVYRQGPPGVDPGQADGLLGQQTFAALLGYTVRRDLGALGLLLGRAMAANFRTYEINTRQRMIHWIAQGAAETDFRTFVERGNGDGPDADPWDDYLERYDFRADLGNSHGGDGERFRGRGIFELTGAANYHAMGVRLGVDLVQHPERAAEPELSVLIACIYWADRKINARADLGRAGIEGVTRAINGGLNGLAARTAFYDRLAAVWPA